MKITAAPLFRIVVRALLYLQLIFTVWLPQAGAATVVQAYASDPSPFEPVIDFLHTSWTVREGAPAGITAIAQTPDGWLWIGSASGLYKFDGVRFLRAVGPDAPLAMGVAKLGVLADGRLWISYDYGGLSLRADGRLHHFAPDRNGLPFARSAAAAMDSTGRLWLATTMGLYYFDTGWRRAGAEFGLGPARGHALLCDARGILWYRDENGLYAKAPGATRFARSVALQDLNGYGELVRHPDGSVWTSDRSGKMRLVTGPRLGSAIAWVRPATHGQFLFDRAGTMWMATGSGAARVGAIGTTVPFERTGLSHGLSGNIVSALFEDREQNIWVATENGLDRFRAPRLRPASLLPYSLMNGSRALAGGPANGVWADAYTIAEPGAPPRRRVPDDGKVITAVVRGADETFYIGGDNQLWRFDRTGLHAIARPAEVPPISLPRTLMLDRENALWVNFGQVGLYRWDGQRWSIPEGVPDGKLNAPAGLATDQQGRIWIGFFKNELGVLVDGKMRRFGAAEGLATGTVEQILLVDHGAYVGGNGGLAWFDGKNFTTLRGRGDEIFTGITGLLLGTDGTLWINGSGGLSGIAAAELQRAVAQPGYLPRFSRLDYRDGVQGGGGGAYSLPSITRSDGGALWFATTGGVYSFDPATLARNTLVPPVLITSVNYADADHLPVDGAHLPSGTRALRIDYTALSYQAPERMQFRYRLEGVDEHWREGQGPRSASYTNLAPGRYTFRVVASNNDGVWNEKGQSLTFEIAPSPTQTIWFRLACVAVLLVLLLAVYLWRARRLAQRYSEKLQERLRERERIARALHDTLLQSMQGLVLRFHSLAKRMPAKDPTRLSMENILDQADCLIAYGREEVLNLRSLPATSDVLTEALTEFGLPLQANFGPTLTVRVLGKPRVVAANAWRDIHSISREAIFNAYRHGGGSTVEVDIMYGAEAFRLVVRDDGAGLSAAVLSDGRKEGHWGLSGMRERARALGGSIEIRNRESSGVEVALLVPAAIAYRAET